MERLTEREPTWIEDESWLRAREPDENETDAVYRKLMEYEDLEEQGRLIRLPVGVGETVWRITIPSKIVPLRTYPCTVTDIKINSLGTMYKLYCHISEDNYSIWVDNWNTQDHFYLTEEEAREAMKIREAVSNE